MFSTPELGFEFKPELNPSKVAATELLSGTEAEVPKSDVADSEETDDSEVYTDSDLEDTDADNDYQIHTNLNGITFTTQTLTPVSESFHIFKYFT
jgi:hypothetical protein